MSDVETGECGHAAPSVIAFDPPTALIAGGAVWLLGLLIRLPGVDATALTATESARAFEAFDVLRGQPVDAVASPLLTYLQAVLFFLFTPSDAAARLVPWLAGIALPALPWLLRRRLGTPACTAASLLLAVSPTLGFFGRYVGASELAMVGCFVSLGLLYGEGPLPVARPVLLGVAVGLTLACGPFGWLGLALLLVALVFAPGAGRPGVGPNRLGALVTREAGLAALLTLLLATTGLLSRLGGFQEGLIDAPASMLARALRSPATGSWGTLPAVLIAYELVPTLLALLGLVAVGSRPANSDAVGPAPAAPIDSVFSTWTVVSLAVLSLLFRAELEAAPLLVVPVCLLAGVAAASFWGEVAPWLRHTPTLALAAGLLFLMVVAGLVLNTATNTAFPTWLSRVVVAIPFVLMVLFAGLAWLWAGRNLTLAAVGIAVGGLLLLGTARASWTLNVVAPANPSELLASEAPTDDARLLQRDLWDRYAVVARGGRPAVQVAVAPELRAPLAWYLRDFESVRFEDPASSPAQVLIATRTLPNLLERPRVYMLTSAEAAAADSQNPFTRIWRWLAFREPGAGERGVLAYVYLRR